MNCLIIAPAKHYIFLTKDDYIRHMKKIPGFCAGILLALFLISWGQTGHRVIGQIAEKHLNAKAKAGVEDLLGGQSLADVANWADEVRGEPEYAHTASWHFLNLPLGLSYAEFETRVESMGPNNVYGALIKCEQDLIYQGTPRAQKIEDLKFIVHFVVTCTNLCISAGLKMKAGTLYS